MNNKIFEAFDDIHAEEELKNNTLKLMQAKIYEKQNYHAVYRKAAAIVCAVLAVVAFSGLGLYRIPVSAVSIDINPSIELELNGLDRVISAQAFNAEGEEIINAVRINNLKYDDAVDLIINSEQALKYISEDTVIEVAVTSKNQQKSADVESGLKNCLNDNSKVNCSCVDYDDAVAAKDCGMSLGKYKAYLELIEIYPQMTAQEAAEMSMSEIKKLLSGANNGNQSNNEENSTVVNQTDNCADNENNGEHNGYMHGKNH